jgi:hypothetical protein
MKLDVQFPDLQAVVTKMGARPVGWKSSLDTLAPPDFEVGLEALRTTGLEIALEDLVVIGPGLLSYAGEQVLQYIKDTKQSKSTLEPGIGNRLILRDAGGRRTGTIEPGIGNRLIIRNRQGRRTGTVEDGIGGRLILRNSAGRRIGTVEPR